MLVVMRNRRTYLAWRHSAMTIFRMLLVGLAPALLCTGSRDWILFDPQQHWQPWQEPDASLAANQPLRSQELTGRVLASGLNGRS